MPLNIPIFDISLSTKSAIWTIYCTDDSRRGAPYQRLWILCVSRNSRDIINRNMRFNSKYLIRIHLHWFNSSLMHTLTGARASNFCCLPLILERERARVRAFHLCLLKQHRSSAIRFEGKKNEKNISSQILSHSISLSFFVLLSRESDHSLSFHLENCLFYILNYSPFLLIFEGCTKKM